MCAPPNTACSRRAQLRELSVKFGGWPRGGRYTADTEGVVQRSGNHHMNKQYDYRQCQSLFGYAQGVHKRSKGVCQLCNCGAGQQVSFDLWRQMTVEHLIGESQGGYLRDIRIAIARRFPTLSTEEHERLAQRINEANAVTACSFCNSTTSRDRHRKGMWQLISDTEGTPDEVVDEVIRELHTVLERKRADVERKIRSVREAFEKFVEPELTK